jgi:hypothetical protein
LRKRVRDIVLTTMRLREDAGYEYFSGALDRVVEDFIALHEFCEINTTDDLEKLIDQLAWLITKEEFIYEKRRWQE